MQDEGQKERRLVRKLSSVEVYRRLLHYLYPYRGQFFVALFAMVVYGATDGVVPYLLKRVLDDVFGLQNEQMLYLLVFAIVGFAVVRGLFGFMQRYLAAGVGLAIVQDIRNEVDFKLLGLSPSFFQRRSTGELISCITNDTLLVRTALTDAAAALLRDTVRIIALLTAAFYLDPVLALIAIIGFPLGLYPVLKFGKKVRRLSRVGQDQFGGLTGLLQESIVGHSIVQAFTKEGYEHDRFTVENKRFTDTYRRAEKYGALSGPTNEVVASLAIAAVILYGGFSVISGVRTQGDFIAFITAIFLLYEPLKKTSRVNSLIQTGVAAAERIFEVLDTSPEVVERPGAKLLVVKEPRVEYRNVSFRYAAPIEDKQVPRWAIRNVSLTVEPGETLALVGVSGGGKSTLVNLLPRFYDPQEGAIFINGMRIDEVSLVSLRRSIAIVSQYTFLFNDTAFNNIGYGREGASREDVISAATAAHADEFIKLLPQGYDTVIGEQGVKLSGGQRARLTIARALLKDAPILILDEATASLDSESEDLVQEAIYRLMEGRTVLVIAHRLATVRRANRIAVMSAGEVVEMGTHEELLERNGEYAKLYNLQFRGDAVQRAEAQARAVGA